jgi:drug/metabolite transporter (DMT)-like permease
MEILLALMSMTCKVFDDFFQKTVANKNGGEYIKTFYILQTATIVLVIAILWGIGIFDIKVNLTNALFGILMGVLSFICYFLFLKSLINSDGATSITIFRLNFIISSALGFLVIKEAVTIYKAIGLGCCILTIFIFMDHKGSTKKKIDKSILYSILACITLGVLNTINKIALSDGGLTNSLLFFMYITVLGLIPIFFGFKEIRLIFSDRQVLKKSSYGFISGCIMLLSLFLLYTAFSHGGDLTVVSPIIQLSFIFTSTLCFIFLKEKFSIRKLAGLILAIISIVIISL